MALPDPNANEPTVEVDPNTVTLWNQARENAAAWKAEEERLRAELEAQVGDRHAGTVGGVKVLTYRPTSTFAQARLRQEHPDLTQQYVKTKIVDDWFDLEAFRHQHPDVAARYQSRQFRAVA